MLAKDYPNTAVFYDVGLSDTLVYPGESQSDFIQILKVAGIHSNKHCKPATVKYTTVDEQETCHFQLKS